MDIGEGTADGASLDVTMRGLHAGYGNMVPRRVLVILAQHSVDRLREVGDKSEQIVDGTFLE